MSANPELSELAQSVSLCQLADCLEPAWPMETDIRPLSPRFRVWGPAVTVLCQPNDNLTLHHALHISPPDHVLVVSGSGGREAALWGELMSMSAQERGLKGTILDCPARDVLEIEALGYPVFSLGITPRRADKRKYGAIGVPISCGSLTVNAGDIIMADVNGILAVPANRFAEVVAAAGEAARKEKEIQEQLQLGRTVFDMMALDRLVPKP